MQQYWIISVPCEPSALKKDSKKNATSDELKFDLKDRMQSAAVNLDRHTESRGYSNNCKFSLPRFKVGSIDALMSLSDELVKLDTSLGQVTKKIERCFTDNLKAEPTMPNAGTEGEAKRKHNVPVELRIDDKLTSGQYVAQFKWNKGLYEANLPLQKLKDKIQDETSQVDEDLRQLSTEYNDVKNTLNAMEKMELGSLMVKPLSKYVKKNDADPSLSDIVETDRFTTLLLVIPKSRQEEFMNSYESMEEEAEKRRQAQLDASKAQQEKERQKRLESLGAAAAAEELAKEEKAKAEADAKNAAEKKKDVPRTVVPWSAKVLTTENDDAEFVLIRVVCFKVNADSDKSESDGEIRYVSNIDNLKSICRDRKFTIRPFHFIQDEEAQSERKMLSLAVKKRQRWEHLLKWCYAQYDNVFQAWIHVKCMRTFVESVLRFGVSNEWYCALIKPVKGYEKNLRSVLADLYKGLANSSLTAALDPNEIDMSGFGQDFYPYVYIPIELEQ